MIYILAYVLFCQMMIDLKISITPIFIITIPYWLLKFVLTIIFALFIRIFIKVEVQEEC